MGQRDARHSHSSRVVTPFVERIFLDFLGIFGIFLGIFEEFLGFF